MHYTIVTSFISILNIWFIVDIGITSSNLVFFTTAVTFCYTCLTIIHFVRKTTD